MRTGRWWAGGSAGFTLLELLISLVLVGVIMAALLSLNIGTSRGTSALQSRNTLLTETQTAQNYLVSRLQTAVYVFPVGSSLILSANGITSRNARTATGTWLVGTDPVVAFIVPPRNSAPAPGSCTASSSSSDNCYYFYAYYPVPRTQLTGIPPYGAATPGVSGANNPGYNRTAPDAWVLMEYRGRYAPPLAPYTTDPAQVPRGLEGRMVLDYLRMQPASGSVGGGASSGAPVLFSQVDTPAQAGSVSVTVQLATRQGSVSVPPDPGNTNQRYSVEVYPRNIGAAPLNN